MKLVMVIGGFCVLVMLAGCAVAPASQKTTASGGNQGGHSVQQEDAFWSSSAEQKIMGLMTIWAEIDQVFPHRDRLAALDWDAVIQTWLPRVLAAESLESYYDVLAELVALLKDSHTEVVPPWGRFRPDFDNLPIEVKIIDGEFYITRVAATREITSQAINPGDRILRVDGQTDIRQYFQDQVLKYHSRGLRHADEAVLVFYLFYGPRNEKVKLELADRAGKTRTVELTRSTDISGGQPFLYEFVESSFAPSLESRRLSDGSLYIMLPNFQAENQGIADGFLALIDAVDFSGVPGMVIDLRQNLGGSDAIMHTIVSSLISQPAATPPHIFFQFTPALIPFGQDPYAWINQKSIIVPRQGKRYDGPLTLLIGPYTHSSAEDMVLVLAGAGRCTTIGQATAGGSGGSLMVPLPWGGQLSVSSFRSTWPDGRDYMSTGIIPDIIVAESMVDILAGIDPAVEMATRIIGQLHQ